ncbi:acetoacetate-CoA ligase [Fusarium oxysporum f. sp. pisi HDV247]|uniref:Acetoacetate-CoA ligase n=1 Tax=Fusarium oxysporum f. sp. pisi HDV247 TaxID=1080344 RepID=W9NWG6_FUSOX|nr:acetoacetate-CoA ligase [Fusarium oxysporum f. sp. pisi HDV247]
MAHQTVPRKLWEPTNVTATEMHKFMQTINQNYGLQLESFQDLYEYSANRRAEFYALLFEWANVIHTGFPSAVVDELAEIDAVPRWFPGINVNWAENILYSRTASDSTDHQGIVGKEDDKIAFTEISEGNTDVRHVPWAELRRDAGRLAAALDAQGVKQGDRVVVVGSNTVNTLLVFLASTWLGAIFVSASTDMGVEAILQRSVQIDPKASYDPTHKHSLMFFDHVATHNGKVTDLCSKMRDVMQGMKSCKNLSGLIIMQQPDKLVDVGDIPGAQTLSSLLSRVDADQRPHFVRVSFSAPLLICYSSGTTGAPKAIVHSVGGILLNLIKEGRLHDSVSADSVVLQYTTTGWIVYVLQIGSLLVGARVVAYQGSPFVPDKTALIKMLGQQHVTLFGTSPRWMQEMVKSGISPRRTADLSALQTVTSTGMVLSDQLFEWVYDVGFPPSIQLINKSGGTDIAGCFGTGNPLSPVFVGGTQGPSLGVPISIYDFTGQDVGNPVPLGVPGELVATAAFPNMPCFFWGDSSSPSSAPALPGSKYHSSYFARFKHVWTHGDLCMIHPQTRNIHFMGRADGVLNPSGVRFGSSEIYSVIDANFSEQVDDSLCVGQRRPNDTDEAVVLFVIMHQGYHLTRQLKSDIKAAVGRSLSKRHIPKYIFEAPEIPVTATGKKVELPVKQIISGFKIKPTNALLYPSSLDFFYQFVNIERMERGLEKL